MSSDIQQQVATTEITLKRRLNALVEDAQAERAASNLSKALGLASLALGGVAAVTTGGIAALPIGVGLVSYLSGVMGQSRKTGRVMPIPFSDAAAIELLGGVAGSKLELPELEDFAYLSATQKSEYAMILCCGSRISQALAHLPSDEHRYFAYSVAKRRFMEMYGSHIKQSPELLMAVDAAEVAEFILASEDDFKQLRAGVEQEDLPAPEPTPEPETTKGNIGPNTRLGAIAVPATPAEPIKWDEDEPLEVSQQADSMNLLKECLHYPSILVYGAPGAGKSTLAEWLIYERIKLGHQVEILDPHRKFGQWEGLPTYGDGMNFKECDERLAAFLALVESRYQQRAKRPNFNSRPITVLTEEFTQWAKRCNWASHFFETSVSDIRKINCHVVYVSHARTMTAIGGAKGLAETRDAALLEIELDAQVDPKTGEASPTGKGRIYYPGRKDAPVEITVPNLAPPTQQATSPDLEAAYSADSDDEVIRLVTEALAQANEPLLASVIRQKKNQLKERFSKEELEGKLRLLAMEGFVKSTGTEPPRYTLP